MDRKFKHGMSGRLLTSVIFAIIGLVYLVISIPMLLLDTFSSVIVIPIIFSVLGTALIVIAFMLSRSELKRRRQINQLIEKNQYRWGAVAEINQNMSITINGRHPYVVTVHCQDNLGQIHSLRSRNILHYVDRSIIGKQVRVYYADDGFSVYYVDIDPLLPNIIHH